MPPPLERTNGHYPATFHMAVGLAEASVGPLLRADVTPLDWMVGADAVEDKLGPGPAPELLRGVARSLERGDTLAYWGKNTERELPYYMLPLNDPDRSCSIFGWDRERRADHDGRWQALSLAGLRERGLTHTGKLFSFFERLSRD